MGFQHVTQKLHSLLKFFVKLKKKVIGPTQKNMSGREAFNTAISLRPYQRTEYFDHKPSKLGH